MPWITKGLQGAGLAPRHDVLLANAAGRGFSLQYVREPAVKTILLVDRVHLSKAMVHL